MFIVSNEIGKSGAAFKCMCDKGQSESEEGGYRE